MILILLLMALVCFLLLGMKFYDAAFVTNGSCFIFVIYGCDLWAVQFSFLTSNLFFISNYADLSSSPKDYLLCFTGIAKVNTSWFRLELEYSSFSRKRTIQHSDLIDKAMVYTVSILKTWKWTCATMFNMLWHRQPALRSTERFRNLRELSGQWKQISLFL